MTIGSISDTTVIVSMAVHQTPPQLVQRAVDSVLSQTHKDLRLIVINDGSQPLQFFSTDQRLFILNLRENNGHYFCHDVVTTAFSIFPKALFKIHDSDDWSDPDALSSLIAHVETGAVFAPFFLHTRHGSVKVRNPRERNLHHPKPQVNRPNARRFARRLEGLGLKVPSQLHSPWIAGASWWTGLFRMSRVLKAGGLHPDFRVAYDTFFVRMIARTGAVNVISHPTYHYDCSQSHATLSRSRASGRGSSTRNQSRERQLQIDREAFDSQEPAAVIRASIAPKTYARVQAYASQLQKQCGVSPRS